VKTEELRQRLHERRANVSANDVRGPSALGGDSGGPDERIVPTSELSPPERSSAGPRAHRRRALVAAAAIVVFAVGAAAIAVRIKDHSRVATTTPTTSRADATIEQYGKVVSESSAAIQAWIVRENSCTHVECSFPQYSRERYVRLRPLLANLQEALAGLPAPPDEIAPLVERTTKHVGHTLNTVDALLDCAVAYPRKICNNERHAAQAAYKGLPAMFAAWRRYA
jgi:hypothetical protein